ncbi:MAG: radical SAM protein [Candidatus Omnitrophica bacterium]|nr:radical SAM protein [Candidatus Omnitrophota bacterium]
MKDIVSYHLPVFLDINYSRACGGSPLFRPIIANINLTSKCCLRCRMCAMWKLPAPSELAAADWKCILGQLRQSGVKYINFTGGEPLSREDLEAIISHSSLLGMRNIIATNGYLLDDARLKGLIRSGANTFCISVDALGETFDDIRGVKGAFRKVEAACLILSQQARKKNIKAIIYATIMKSTLTSIPAVVEFAERLGLKVFFNLLDFTPYFFRGAKCSDEWIGQADYAALDNLVANLVSIKRRKPYLFKQGLSSLRYISAYFRDPLQKDIPCCKSHTRIMIGPEGLVYAGCWSMGEAGDLRVSQLRGIINSPFFKNQQRGMFKKACPGCSCGYETDLKYSVGHLLRDAAFSLRSGLTRACQSQ